MVASRVANESPAIALDTTQVTCNNCKPALLRTFDEWSQDGSDSPNQTVDDKLGR